MGLYVHSIGSIPDSAERSYYIYILDYGWEEGLGEAVRKNLQRMSDLASRSDAVVIHGPRGVHFEDEVLSWHNVNGQDSSEILPAILITTRHPATFRESFSLAHTREKDKKSMLLLPLRTLCKSADDLVALVGKIFKDIEGKQRLSEFQAAKQMKSGVAGALADAVILQPNISGLGFDVKEFFARVLRG